MVSFRSSFKIFNIFQESCSVFFSFFNYKPSWKTTYNWVLKVGLSKLITPKEKADDWIYIIDFKVQSGSQKCFVVLGVRLSDLIAKIEKKFCLSLDDMVPLKIELMERSCGERINEILEQITLETGPALQIIADHGSDILKGIKLYCKNHTKTIATYDITHKLACLLKSDLHKDEIWQKIQTLMNETKQRTKQTSEVALTPPRQKEKARFMNIDIQIDWLEEMINFLGHEMPEFLDAGRVKEKLGWIITYEESIHVYIQMLQVARDARNLIRTQGLHPLSYLDITDLWKKNCEKQCSRVIEFRNKIIEFIKVEGEAVPQNMVLPGSSEAIESLFGKYKQIEVRTKSTKSITGMILSLAALVGKNTVEVIFNALETISIKTIKLWQETAIGFSDLSKRRRIYKLNLVRNS